MTIARRLAILPVMALMGILLISMVLMHDIGSVYHSASYANDNSLPSMLALQKLDSNFIGVRLNVWQHVATPDAAGLAAAEKQMAGRRQKVDDALNEYEALAADQKDKDMLAADRAAILYYDTIMAKVLPLSRAGHKNEAIEVLMGVKAELAKATDALIQHQKYNVEMAATASEAAAHTRLSAIRMGILLTLATVAMVGAIGVVIFRQITRQLGGEPADVAEVANKVAKGDFSSRIELRAGDTTSLFATVAKMQQDLKARTEADRARADSDRARVLAEHAAAVENARIRTALDRVSAGVTLIDTGGQIIYINDFAADIFRTHAPAFRAQAPHFDPDRIIGTTFESLHHGTLQRVNRLAELTGSQTEELKVGAATLRIVVTPVADKQGVRVGTVVQWTDRTQEIAVEQEVATTVARAIAGDLTARVLEDDKQGFFKILAAGMNNLVVSVAGMIRTMSKAANEVRAGADEISSGNLDLSQRTEEQASSLEQTAASMEQMTAMVKSNADNAAQANQLAAAARQQAERGGKVVSAAVSAMTDINAASKKIADIIGVIDDIAFQTNLLALNAAVEAARAGEQGRGFAVVASEVRNLASRSAEAAKQIKALIQDSVAKVSDGSRLVDESGKVLGEIVTGVQKVTDVMAEIAASSMEQASGIEQVNKAVTMMDGVTQQNAALVEEASAAAQTLTEQAANLTEEIAKYRLDDHPAPTARPLAPPPVAAGSTERRAANRPFRGKPAPAPAPQAGRAPQRAVGGADTWQEF